MLETFSFKNRQQTTRSTELQVPLLQTGNLRLGLILFKPIQHLQHQPLKQNFHISASVYDQTYHHTATFTVTQLH